MAMLGNIDTQGIAMNQVVYLVASAPVALLLALLYWRCAHDPKEPPLIPPGIPIIGHALGIIQHGVAYYTRHSARYPSQLVYTMDLLLNKAYIINSPSLVAAVQRNHRVISFDPFLTGAANRMAGITGPGLELLREEQNGGQGINNKVLHSMHPALLGTGLDRMNEKMIKFLKLSVDELATTHDTGTALDFHAWCRHAITVASTDAVYGLLNPYKKREIEDSLWAFESRLTPLLINIMPSITSRTSYKARERLVSAFVKYYEAGGHEDSSELTYNRWKVQNDAGATTQDIARLEAAAGIGILSNTVPSTFWTIFDIYSRPSLLSELREEVCKNGMIIEPNTGLHVIDLASIRDSCHLLVSSFQETLRLRSNGAPTRVVCKDILLNGQWLLKEGSILQMPAPTINRQPVAWGEATDDFNPRRFMKDVAQKDLKRATAFMSFGASPNICPGRHFASGEILALAAMIILRYDITPVSGVWRPPVLNTKAMAASVTPPGEEFPVKISEREEFRGVKWDFRVTEGRGKFSLVVG